MDQAMQTTAAAAVYPSIEDIHAALKAAAEEALDVVKYEAGSGGRAALWYQLNGEIRDEEDPEKMVGELVQLMGCVIRQPDHTAGNDDLTLVAHQLHQLYSMYFAGRPQLWRDCNPEAIVNGLVRKAIRIVCGRLWPDGSWISTFHKPNPTWLSEHEYSSVVGEIEFAVEYKKMLHRLGYAPLSAPTKEALDNIWHDLYNMNQDYNKLDASSALSSPPELPISPLDKYAVVSYVQCANGKKPPASWTTEVDSVLTGLVQSGVIPEKVLWFDKLASRQYKDSQKWWGAAATMQFLFNPVIVILHRMSEHSSFAPTVGGPSIWGSGEAVDAMYADFLQHARNCKECQSSFALRWALQQDHVIPFAALRTWPRVEHALGASGLGLFTSEATYSALVACLTCAFAMFGALWKNDPDLYDALDADATHSLPSTYRREDGSILIGSWVIVSCSEWQYSSYSKVLSMAALLKEMASCVMELHHLFCQMHNPRLLALGRTSQNASKVLVYEMVRLSEAPGLFYPKGEKDVDVPTLARFNSNNIFRLNRSHNDLPEDAVVTLHHHWALVEIHQNQPQVEISTTSFVAARQKALSTLVYTKAAQAPCYDWSDKLVAAILLSLPNLFADAVTFWNKGSDWLTPLSSLLLSEVGITDFAETDQEIEWEPNTLIAALAMLQRKPDLHRLVPRPPGVLLSQKSPVNVQPFVGESKCFSAFALGHLPMRSLDALGFRTTANTSLPQGKEWVRKMLQDGALCSVNVAVIRSLQPQEGENRGIRHCWHCQKLGRESPAPGKHSTDAGGLVVDMSTLQDFVDDILNDRSPENAEPGLMWGLGSFDPLNLAALCREDCYFGEAPDTVAVLLERRGRGSSSAENAAASTYAFHAHALAHFSILGSAQTHKCNACHAIILREKYTHGNDNGVAFWTILPISSYKGRYELIPGFGEIL